MVISIGKVKTGLRELLKSEDVLVVPGVYAPSVAMLAERIGFKAVYLSGAALTGLLGMPDLGIITLTEVALFTKYITSKISIPLIVDADTGFGEVLNIERTVRELEDAGASAVQIEDQVLPKKCGHLPGKEIVPVEEMVEKIIMATKTRRSRDFLIIARTDARAVEGLEKAIERAKIYVEAGADIIFPEALESREEFEIFAKKIDVPLLANMTEFGKSPLLSVKELRDIGYKIVLFPVTTFRASMKASEKILKIIMEKGTQREDLNMLMTRSEFYELINYYDYEKKDDLISKLAKDLMIKTRSLTSQ